MPINSQAYGAIAERHLMAARVLLREGLHEVAVFHCYHAFESMACAALLRSGRRVPRNHERKIRAFLSSLGRQTYGVGLTALAEVLLALRNRMLYPSEDEFSPQESMTVAEAERLLRRVEGSWRVLPRP